VSATRRGVSVRDVLKCCDRCEKDFAGITLPAIIPAKMKEMIFQHCLDTYCCVIPKPEVRHVLVDVIATLWGISTDRKLYFQESYKPVITPTRTLLTIGSISLDVLPSVALTAAKHKPVDYGSKFAYSRQSSLLIEKLARCVHMQEPALLVGETGCGKTKVVQHLAHLLNRTLVVLNMNQQVCLIFFFY
jgi:midasin